MLPPDRAAVPWREARGERLSVRAELRTLLWLGVTLIAAGVSLLVRANLERIGPVTIAVAIGAAAAGVLAWVVRRAPPFDWGERPSPHLAFDFLLLLGVLLAAADLAYVEVQFAALGEQWPWHLLLVALFAGALAVRYDSRVLWTFALSSFAAWRGVAVRLERAPALLFSGEAALRANAILCGALFVALAAGLVRGRRKAHFAPVTDTLGWLLIAGGAVSGALQEGPAWPAWGLALLGLGAGLAFWSFRRRRFWRFALGVVAAYVALSRFALEPLGHDAMLGCYWFFVSSLLVIAALVAANLRLRRTA